MDHPPQHAGTPAEVKPEAEEDAASDTGEASSGENPKPRPDPTRYGDWEIGGRCIDF